MFEIIQGFCGDGAECTKEVSVLPGSYNIAISLPDDFECLWGELCGITPEGIHRPATPFGDIASYMIPITIPFFEDSVVFDIY